MPTCRTGCLPPSTKATRPRVKTCRVSWTSPSRPKSEASYPTYRSAQRTNPSSARCYIAPLKRGRTSPTR
eukprot:1819495-Pleurochrysis_carterae.AAC.2